MFLSALPPGWKDVLSSQGVVQGYSLLLPLYGRKAVSKLMPPWAATGSSYRSETLSILQLMLFVASPGGSTGRKAAACHSQGWLGILFLPLPSL